MHIAGYVDGEGSFHVAVQRNDSTSVGLATRTGSPMSAQSADRRQVLDLIRQRFGCGRPGGSLDTCLVFGVR